MAINPLERLNRSERNSPSRSAALAEAQKHWPAAPD